MTYAVENQVETIRFFNNDEVDAPGMVNYQEHLCAPLPNDGYMQVFSVPMVGLDKDQAELIYRGILHGVTASQIKTVKLALAGEIEDEALTNGEIFSV